MNDSELESCCICLDALSSGAAAVLIAPYREDGSTSPWPKRVCQHFVHLSCAEKLHPRKCPLCRRSFTELSIPLDEKWLLATSPEEIIQGLCRLDGLPKPPLEEVAMVSTQSVVELLAATIPIPEEILLKELAVHDSSMISAEGLRRLLLGLGIEPQRNGTCSKPAGKAVRQRYSVMQRIYWRLRWLSLKACGAAGAGCSWGAAGLAAGVLLGGVAAVPARAWPDIQSGENQFILAIKAAYLGGLLLYYGMQRLDLVALGLKVGSILGVTYGFFHGLVAVDPENHGFRSVFWAGLAGFSSSPPRLYFSKDHRVAWPGQPE
mgnify:CR=1 FL=1